VNTPNFQPTLTGELLELRPLRSEDFEALYSVACDPLVWEQHPNSDRYKEDVFREFFREAMASGGAFATIDLKDGKIIGSSQYYGYSEEKSEIEIGWSFLACSYWGGVYNREMKHLMLRHAFQFVDRVNFFIGPNNIRSQMAIKKIGGVFVRESSDDTGRESVVYQISKEAFLG
jgi:RimJ/RimL family protein N-acetyltransferase